MFRPSSRRCSGRRSPRSPAEPDIGRDAEPAVVPRPTRARRDALRGADDADQAGFEGSRHRKPASGKSATDKPRREVGGEAAHDSEAGGRATATASETAEASGTADVVDIRVADATPATKTAPKPRATRKPTAAKATAPAVGADATSASAAPPKRRTPRKTAEVDPA